VTTPCQTPRPGPDYWSWRCLVCDLPIRAHDGWWMRLLRALRARVGKGCSE
jgi:hypothetical protein